MRSSHLPLLCASVFGFCLAADVHAQKPAPVLEIPNAAQPQLAASKGQVWVAYGRALAAPPAPPAAADAHAGGGKGHGGGKRKGGHHGGPRPDGDVFVARSETGGGTFASPVKVATVPQLMLGRRRGPRIAAHGDRVTVTVVAHELLAFTSLDGGRTWAKPVTINDVPTSAREGLHDLAAAPDGRLFVTWLDLRNGRMELWGANSQDAGCTWGANQLVYRSPDKSICECCHPTAQFDAQGNLAVMWRNSIEGARDMWIAERSKGAAEFTPARKLGHGTWTLNACPMDGGKLVALGGGRFGATWQRAGEVYFSRADGGPEVLVGRGTQPVGVAGRGDTMVFWQQGSDLMVVRNPGRGGPSKHASDARFAASVAVPGHDRTMLAYEKTEAKDQPPRIVVEAF